MHGVPDDTPAQQDGSEEYNPHDSHDGSHKSGSEMDISKNGSDGDLGGDSSNSGDDSRSQRRSLSSKHHHIRFDDSDDTDDIIDRQIRLQEAKLRRLRVKAALHANGPRMDRPLGGHRAAVARRFHNSSWRFPMSLPADTYGCSEHWLKVAQLAPSNSRVRHAAELAAEKAKTLEAQKRESEAQRRQADEALRLKEHQLRASNKSLAEAEKARDQAIAERDAARKELAKAVTERDSYTSKSFIQSLRRPQQFSGDRKSDKQSVQEWLVTVDDYLFSTKIASSDIMKVQFAEGHLQGDARRAWAVRKMALHRPTAYDSSPYAGITYDDFRQHVLEQWNPACTAVQKRFEMDALRQDNMLMPTFVNKFDDLCTYFPHMDEDDKIHKFLTKLSDAYADITIDPTTRSRWTSYQLLRDYALTYAASQANRVAARKRTATGTFNELKQVLKGNGKRQRTDSGYQQHGSNQHQAGSSAAAGSAGTGARTASSSGAMKNLQNKHGVAFKRHINLFNWCHANNICNCCYASYTKEQRGEHRENCPSAPAKGLPDGYTIPNRKRQA